MLNKVKIQIVGCRSLKKKTVFVTANEDNILHLRQNYLQLLNSLCNCMTEDNIMCNCLPEDNILHNSLTEDNSMCNYCTESNIYNNNL